MSDTQYQNDLSPTEVRQTESACDRFEAAWRSGQKPRFEEYLSAHGDPARAVLLRELLIIDWEYRRLAGDNPKAGDYVARMPDAAALIDRVQRELTEKSDPTMVGANQRTKSSPGNSGITAISGDARYEMMAEVGQGGIGIVYRCRDRVLGRELAIKVLREKYQNQDDARRRFIDEARIGSRLQHPAIVPVHELGEFADRRPYFTMKLVEGQTLSTLLRERPRDSAAMLLADLSRWLAVFEAVCQAMAYAHAQGVVHRDLKPANVMVGAFGEVQVMDWGFAKQLGIANCALQNAGESADQPSAICNSDDDTQSGAMMGTPSYMPPEQARGQISLIDRRTDVFALGAMLCEILTGRPPYAAGGAGETCRQAAEGDLDAAYSMLNECGADRDLCELAKRCLACEQSARPADASVVAKEITAHLASAQRRLQEVQVERAAAEARAQVASTKIKVERRARFLSLALAATLLLGAAFTAWQAVVATRAKDDAMAAAKAQKQAMELAVAKESETQKVLDFVQDQVFSAARPKGRPGGLGHDVPLITALKAALPYVDKYLADQPLTEARLRLTLGDSFRDLGDLENAADQCRKAHATYTKLLAPDHEDTLLSMDKLATSLEWLGKNQDAFDLREKALALRTAKLGPEHAHTLTSMSNLADSLHSMGRHTEALALREKAQLLTSKLGPDHPDTLACMNNLARSYDKVGRRADAMKLLEQALPLYQSRIGPEHPDTLMVMNNLAASYNSVGRNTEALALHEPALALRRKVLGPEHHDTLTSMSNLAACYFSLRRFEEAHRLLEDALEIRSSTLGSTHLDTLENMNSLAKSFDGQRRYAEALKLRQAALEGQKARLGPNHPDTLRTMWGLSACLYSLDRGPEAIAVLDDCVRRSVGNKDIDPKMIPAVMDFRLRYFQQQKDAEACRTTAEMWEQFERDDAASLYMAARCRAVTAALMGADKASSVTANEEADRAMAWLKRAFDAGYKDAAKLNKDADFEALRERADFQALTKIARPDGR